MRSQEPADRMSTPGPPPGRLTGTWLVEARRKAIHFCALVLPLSMLYEWLPWPRGRHGWAALLLALTAIAMVVDVVRLHDRRVKRFFQRFLGEMIREHEQFSLLGSTYLLIAATLAVELFSPPVAAAAIGFTVLGDGVAALAGRAFGRTRVFHKTLEGAAAGLAACLAWAAWIAHEGRLSWEVVVCGALVAMLIEILPIPLDDNLGMTLVSGYVMRALGSRA